MVPSLRAPDGLMLQVQEILRIQFFPLLCVGILHTYKHSMYPTTSGGIKFTHLSPLDFPMQGR